MWSSPRNLSTAMMYSWRQRSDTTVVDEPLYGYYLATTGRSHPGDSDVIEAQNTNGDEVIAEVLLGGYDTPVVFFKQMAKHLLTVDRSFLSQGPNILLTREPRDMLSSLQVQLPDVTIDDTGFVELCSILDSVLDAGEEPVVVETRSLLANPEGVLRALCERLALPFEDAMLSWPAGPKPEDGVWAPHWYDSVWKSTGWQPYAPKNAVLVPSAEAALDQATAAYERLLPYRVTGK